MTNKIDPLVDVRSGYRVTTTINDNNRKIEQALENTLSLDGSTPNGMQAPLDLNQHKLINVAPGTTGADAVTKAQLDSLGENLPASTIDQIATRVAELIAAGGGVTPPAGYTNPPAPTVLTTSAIVYNSVTLSWTMSSTTWAEGYTITRNGVALPPVRGGSTLTFTDTTVSPNTTYTYAISAYNDSYAYDSAFTSATPITTPSTTVTGVSPGTPTLTAVQTTAGVVSLSWTYNSTAPVDWFWIQRDGSDLPAFQYGTQRTYIDNGVPAGVHSYTITGQNVGYGRGTPSAPVNVTVTSPTAGTPAAPTSPTATAINTTSIQVGWTYSGNLHDGFLLQITGPTPYYNEIIISDKAARNYVLTGLTPTTSYSVVISAFTRVGTSITTYPAAAVVGTTSTGIIPTPLDFAPGTNFNISGVIGTASSTTMPTLTTVGGITGATILFINQTALPSGVGLTTAGVFTGTPASVVSGQVVAIAATDGVNTVYHNFVFTISPTLMVVTPPTGVNPGDTIIATGGTSFSKTWTATGGTGPYTIVVNGVLPTSITATTTSPSAVIAGNSSQAYSNPYPINIDITSADGQNFNADYTIQFNSNVASNSPPVFGSVTTPQTFVRDTAYTDMNTLVSTDSDGQTPTLVLTSAVLKVPLVPDTALSITGPSSGIYTVTGTGITFDSNYASSSGSRTGRFAGTYTSTYDNTQIVYTVSADDGVNLPFTVSCDLPTLYTVGVSAIPSGKKVVAIGGTGSYTYSTSPVTGTMPTWLGNTISASTGVISGATGSIVAGTTTFVLRATDGTSTADVTVTIVANASTVVSDFETRVTTGGYNFAMNMQKVYINGVQDTTRTITSLGTSGNYGTSYKTTLLGQAVGGPGQANISWVDDPSGWQTKVARFTDGPTLTESAGTMTFFLDGHLNNSTAGGTVFRKCYFMWSFFGKRDYFAYRDPVTAGDQKLGYLGSGFLDGEVLIVTPDYTGCFIVCADLIGVSSIPPITKHWPNIANPHILPTPNPWAKTPSTNDGQIFQASGQWSETTPYKQVASGTPPTGTTQADKDAYYQYYGYLDGSNVGLGVDTTGYGVSGVDGSNVVTPWMDQRTHMRNGVDKSWPDSDVAIHCPTIGIDKWNYVQLFFECDANGNGYAAGWHAIAGEAPKLIAANAVNFGTSADANASHKFANIMLYMNNRPVNPNRPTAGVDFGEVICSTTKPIAFPGGFIPPFNRG